MIRIVFLARSLNRGGAERQMLALARGLPADRFQVSIVTYYSGGALAEDLRGRPDIQLYSLDKRGRWDLLKFAWRLWSLLRRLNPDIIHGYLNLANELSLICGKLVGAKVIWGLRASNMVFAHYNWATAWLFRIGAPLSWLADAIIVNSHAGKDHYLDHGYSARQMVVIPNGIDVERFRPDPAARQRIRQEWGVRDDDLLIGVAARLDPMKDHATFLRAAALLVRTRKNVRFVCVGDDPLVYRRELESLAEQLGLTGRVIWAGARDDMPAVYSAFDIAVSSSAFGEGFSNALGEAVACGVPCVTTDVGDSAIIVRDAARIVPPGDSEALAAAVERLSAMSEEGRLALATADRARVVQRYGTAALVERTAAVLTRLDETGERRRGGARRGE